MKRVFILHGWGEYPDKGWFPWLKKELEKKGVKAEVLKMVPQPPVLSKWKDILSKAVGKPDKDTYFVCHSAGVQTALHYIAELPAKTKVGGIVMVAGWVDGLGMPELKHFFDAPLNWKAVREHCAKFIAIYSDNDPYVKTYHAESLEDELGAENWLAEGMKHFSHEEGVDKLPIALKAVMAMMK